MITVKQRNGKQRKTRPSFIHGHPNEKGGFTDGQLHGQLLEDIRNVMESMVREIRKTRKFLAEAVKLAGGGK